MSFIENRRWLMILQIFWLLGSDEAFIKGSTQEIVSHSSISALKFVCGKFSTCLAFWLRSHVLRALIIGCAFFFLVFHFINLIYWWFWEVLLLRYYWKLSFLPMINSKLSKTWAETEFWDVFCFLEPMFSIIFLTRPVIALKCFG